MGGKGGGGTTINQPPPIDPGKAMGEYLFGRGFSNYEGVTDSRLQERLIGAEARYRPQYAALELADINTFAQGIAGGKDNPQYKRLEAQLAGLEAGAAAGGKGLSSEEAMKIARSAVGLRPGTNPYEDGSSMHRVFGLRTSLMRRSGKLAEMEADHEAEIQSIAQALGSGSSRASQIASIKAEMGQLETQKGQGGLFDLLEEQSTRAGALQREQLGLQREADVGALQEFAPQVVEAYRDADPYSTEIAESMSRKAMGQLTPEEQRGVDQRARQGSLARGRIGDQSSLAAEALGRSDYTAQFAQPAFGMNRQLAGDVGMTILGRPSSAIGLGSQMLGQAQQGASGPMGPQLFDPNVGINMAMQEQSNQVSLLGAQAQADASRSAGKSSMMGSIGAAAIGAI